MAPCHFRPSNVRQLHIPAKRCMELPIEREGETAMDKPMSNFDFQFMSVGYKFRDFFLPRKNILEEVGIKPGFYVLDYGCGPGSYIVPLAKLVGESGKIYALDIHPLAIRKVRGIASKNNWRTWKPFFPIAKPDCRIIP